VGTQKAFLSNAGEKIAGCPAYHIDKGQESKEKGGHYFKGLWSHLEG
jgi:hypothetical protein